MKNEGVLGVNRGRIGGELITLIVAGAAWVALMPGCKKKTAKSGSLGGLVEPAAKRLPASVQAVAIVDFKTLGHMADGSLNAWLGSDQRRGAMIEEMGSVCRSRVGIDCTAARWSAGFVGPANKAWGFVVVGHFSGSLHVPAVGDRLLDRAKRVLGGTVIRLSGDVLATKLGHDLALGNLAGLKMLVEVKKGVRKSFRSSDQLPVLKKLLTRSSGPQLAVFFADARTLSRTLPFKADTALASISRRGEILVAVQADAAALKMMQQLIAASIEQAKTILAARKTDAVRLGPLGSALEFVAASHLLKTMLAHFHVARSTKVLTIRLALPNAGLWVPMIGAMSAVAIPTFIKYIRRAKAAEAHMNVARIFAGAQAYLHAKHADATGKVVSCQLPPSVGWTPSQPPCRIGQSKYVSTKATWQAQTWKDVHFILEARHYYQYRLTTTGTGVGATVVVEARGDLDCDGTYSSFRLKGTVGKAALGNRSNGCRLTATGGMETTRPEE